MIENHTFIKRPEKKAMANIIQLDLHPACHDAAACVTTLALGDFENVIVLIEAL
jgi:hypothetical protein